MIKYKNYGNKIINKVMVKQNKIIIINKKILFKIKIFNLK